MKESNLIFPNKELKEEYNQFNKEYDYDYNAAIMFGKIKKRINVEKGCPNAQCFCTGKCKEVIGYWENGNYIDLGKTSLKQ